MSKVFVFFKLILLIQTNSNLAQKIAQPITDLIDILFIQKQIHFDVIVYGERKNQIMDVLGEIVKSNEEKFAEKVQVLHPEIWNHEVFQSAVILLSDCKLLSGLSKEVYFRSFSFKPIHFIVYCKDLLLDDILSMEIPRNLSRTQGRISMFSYFLTKTIGGYDLMTIEWFMKGLCNKPKIVTLNFFDKSSMKWEKDLEINEKFRNFYKCRLTLMLLMNHFSRKDKFDQIYGPPVDIFKAMSQRGNFKYRFQRYKGTIELKNIELKPILNKGIEYPLHASFLLTTVANSAYFNVMHYTTLFFEEKVSFVISPSEAYTSYEKLLLPFDLLTWIFSIAVILIAFVSIIVVKMLSKKAQDIFYGSNVGTPALNIITVIFGISQINLPSRNFPRIILVTFILFCLVMRTAYQGVLFEMTAADIRKPLPSTIEDLYNDGYMIYVVNEIEGTIYRMIPDDLR